MRRGMRALMTDLVAAAALVLAAATAPAWAGEPAADRDLPVALSADTVEYDTGTGRVIASGSVEIYYGERTLTADRIVYDSDTGRITAIGGIVLRDPSASRRPGRRAARLGRRSERSQSERSPRSRSRATTSGSRARAHS